MSGRQKLLNRAKHEAKLAEWRERVRECRHSGQQIKQWCEENGINEKTYYRWQKMVWETEVGDLSIEAEKNTGLQFIEVPKIQIEPQVKEAGIKIEKGEWRIELQNNANPAIIRQIMQLVAQNV